MISKHGARLMSKDAEEALKRKLLPHALLVTPNVSEAEALAGMEIQIESDMRAAADRLLDFGCKTVLIKGGHLAGEPIDLLVGCGETQVFAGRRVETPHTHGTGCAYSAAITAGLAKGENLLDAIRSAKAWIQEAIKSAPGLGNGCGPVNFFSVSTSERSGRPYRSTR
jgi:hydroxymethylpyrimidine/phosphomethylpyrimidine kinase